LRKPYADSRIVRRCIPALAVLFLTLAPRSVWGQQPEEIDEDKYAKDATTEINVKNADIGAIIRIFSKKTKRNFILDERVAGKHP
jgi:type II secretory pathway component GspD/PulD (secretin)